ncbi:NUDIX hydrolase (macronuclear) [Tetrahymena thermophila SB210]|uniref:NUDIX hydrolase n=1 Tax=Tetrahymena thermophila (strain SB210) TaxID=312017 RepID=W7XIG9_TETTS|nr:NUDIX hydrolase [Tetrahymena thermophila SB210]EWS74631.1 NUDIX hydrolase [Tetrahymena thermophila SB210]|eukprot:XP_012652853.1 NUDIX hydrolase [Tetrahymena thermophila SB210]
MQFLFDSLNFQLIILFFNCASFLQLLNIQIIIKKKSFQIKMIFLKRQLKFLQAQKNNFYTPINSFYQKNQFQFSSSDNSQNTEQQQEYDKYGRKFPPRKGEYLVPSITTDAVVLRKYKNYTHRYEVLMIKRKNEPYKGYLAFPGGFLDYNEEPSQGCLRELKEETGLDGISCELITVKGEPQRDPREHIVSIFYKVEVDQNQRPIANDDAADARFYRLEKLLKPNKSIAFDHLEILNMVYNKVRKYEKKKKTRIT